MREARVWVFGTLILQVVAVLVLGLRLLLPVLVPRSVGVVAVGVAVVGGDGGVAAAARVDVAVAVVAVVSAVVGVYPVVAAAAAVVAVAVIASVGAAFADAALAGVGAGGVGVAGTSDDDVAEVHTGSASIGPHTSEPAAILSRVSRFSHWTRGSSRSSSSRSTP